MCFSLSTYLWMYIYSYICSSIWLTIYLYISLSVIRRSWFTPDFVWQVDAWASGRAAGTSRQRQLVCKGHDCCHFYQSIYIYISIYLSIYLSIYIYIYIYIHLSILIYLSTVLFFIYLHMYSYICKARFVCVSVWLYISLSVIRRSWFTPDFVWQVGAWASGRAAGTSRQRQLVCKGHDCCHFYLSIYIYLSIYPSIYPSLSINRVFL
jgi:uncharacterized protein YfiM (DUF2279 family)